MTLRILLPSFHCALVPRETYSASDFVGMKSYLRVRHEMISDEHNVRCCHRALFISPISHITKPHNHVFEHVTKPDGGYLRCRRKRCRPSRAILSTWALAQLTRCFCGAASIGPALQCCDMSRGSGLFLVDRAKRASHKPLGSLLFVPVVELFYVPSGAQPVHGPTT
jgi:hypothetical protein